MYLEVMYSEPLFKRIRAEAAEIDTLPKDNVLCMVLIHEGKLLWRLYSKDHYAIGFVGDRPFVDEWDDNDVLLWIYSLAEKKWQQIQYNRYRPTNSTVYTFEGGYVEPKDWERVLEIMNKEMR